MFGFTLIGDVCLVLATAVAVWIFKDKIKAVLSGLIDGFRTKL
jgi:hypothetical protein